MHALWVPNQLSWAFCQTIREHPSARNGPFLLRSARCRATFAFCRHTCPSASRHHLLPPRSWCPNHIRTAIAPSLASCTSDARAARWMTMQRLKRVISLKRTWTSRLIIYQPGVTVMVGEEGRTGTLHCMAGYFSCFSGAAGLLYCLSCGEPVNPSRRLQSRARCAT